MKNKIGIFGGSFNPITMAHIHIAEESAKKLKLTRLMFEPTNDEYNKKGLVNIEHRMNMIQLIYDDEGSTINGTIFDIGAIDAFSSEKMYTYQLLKRYNTIFNKEYWKLFYIMGSDNLKTFNTWKEYEKIFDIAELIVHRRGHDDMIEIIRTNPLLAMNIDKIHIFDKKQNNISSTIIRNWIKNNNNISGRYLPKKVFNYIKENKLYENKDIK